MLMHPTHDRLVALGLTGMAKALDEQRGQSNIEGAHVQPNRKMPIRWQPPALAFRPKVRERRAVHLYGRKPQRTP